MEVKLIQPPVSPFLQVKLDQHIIDYLWNIIDNKRTKNSGYLKLVDVLKLLKDLLT